MSRSLGERRRAREYALQLLFQLDLAPGETADAIDEFWAGKKVVGPVQEFADQIVCGTMRSRDGIVRARGGETPRDHRDLPRARDPHHGDVGVGGAMTLKTIERGQQQLLARELVEAARHHREAQPFGVETPFDRLRHRRSRSTGHPGPRWKLFSREGFREADRAAILRATPAQVNRDSRAACRAREARAAS